MLLFLDIMVGCLLCVLFLLMSNLTHLYLETLLP